jgi:hypothetical protein
MMTFIWIQANASLEVHGLSNFILPLRLHIVTPADYAYEIQIVPLPFEIK